MPSDRQISAFQWSMLLPSSDIPPKHWFPLTNLRFIMTWKS